MRILVAEDDPVSRKLLVAWLQRWGHEVLAASDGAVAYRLLKENPDIPLVVIDWMMPEMDGVTLCRSIRTEIGELIYVILLTAMSDKSHVAAGLEAGADDYMTKPFDSGELRARIQVGERTVNLKRALAEKITELESALSHVKQLQGILPICMHCKRIRDDQKSWHDIDRYVALHTDAKFSHGICAVCLEKHHPEDS